MSSGFDTGSGTPPIDFTEFHEQRARNASAEAALARRAYYPNDLASDPPQKTHRNDVLAGMYGDSASSRQFVRAHGGVAVWPEPNNSERSNRAIFSGENVRHHPNQAVPNVPAYDGDLQENASGDIEELIADLSVLFDCTEQEVSRGIEEACRAGDMPIEEVSELLIPEINALVETSERLGITPSDIIEMCTTEDDDDELTDVNESLRTYACEILNEIKTGFAAKRHGVKVKQSGVKKKGVTFSDPAPAPGVKFSGISGTSSEKKRKPSSGIVGEGVVMVSERLARLLRGHG